jgi:putative membrane protein
MRFLVRLVATAAALWLAVQLVPGIVWTGSAVGLLGVALVFGILNALVRPLLTALSCPLIILTLGLFLLVLNAVMLLLTAAVSNSLGLGFRVEGFIPAFVGALVVSITSAGLSVFVGEPRKKRDE